VFYGRPNEVITKPTTFPCNEVDFSPTTCSFTSSFKFACLSVELQASHKKCMVIIVLWLETRNQISWLCCHADAGYYSRECMSLKLQGCCRGTRATQSVTAMYVYSEHLRAVIGRSRQLMRSAVGNKNQVIPYTC